MGHGRRGHAIISSFTYSLTRRYILPLFTHYTGRILMSCRYFPIDITAHSINEDARCGAGDARSFCALGHYRQYIATPPPHFSLCALFRYKASLSALSTIYGASFLQMMLFR